jgi:hypothetical protein
MTQGWEYRTVNRMEKKHLSVRIGMPHYEVHNGMTFHKYMPILEFHMFIPATYDNNTSSCNLIPRNKKLFTKQGLQKKICFTFSFDMPQIWHPVWPFQTIAPKTRPEILSGNRLNQ